MPPRRWLSFEWVSGAATLFDADEATYSGTVEVLGVIFRAEDDGYAVLEVQDGESGEGFALVGPVAHLGAGERAEVSGEWQTHSRYGRQLRARGALPLDPADREGQVAYLTSLRHIGPARAERAAPTSTARGCSRRSPPTPPGSSAPCAGSAPTRPRRRRSPGTPAAPSATSTSSSPPTASPTWRRRSTPATARRSMASCTRTPTG